jgi:hypothetical protein
VCLPRRLGRIALDRLPRCAGADPGCKNHDCLPHLGGFVGMNFMSVPGET